ncbi:MAG TPA: DsbA family protein [Thermoleophilaceae bacterium]|nr:DsbA family protein [Thermoleophilaceae bacterium]
MPVHVRYYTDPACSESFGNEPVLRKLMVEFGADVNFTYVMGGLARTYEGDLGWLVREWLDVSERSSMPIDPRLWLEGPIHSTYPACMAVKAATEQSADGGYAYLRALREGLLCFRRKLDSTEPLVDAARSVGLDPERFRIDLESHATVEAFGLDLEAARAVPDEARARAGVEKTGNQERLVLPSASFDGESGPTRWVFGPMPYQEWRAAALAAGAKPADQDRPSVLGALQRFGRMATVEVGAVCDLPGPAAGAELWKLAAEWKVAFVRVLAGWLFEPA